MLAQRVVLCADDYGLSPGVSRGIRALVGMNRLSSVGCMVDYPEFEAEGPLLRPYFGKVDLGLHFSLTSDRSLASVMRDAHFGGRDRGRITDEVERQLAAFARVMGRQPDYIDGHRHVHLLPGVRGAIAGVAARIGAYVRSTREPIGMAMSRRPSPLEAAYLSWTARPLDRLAREHGLVTNIGFRGVRSFREAVPYRGLFRRMIDGAKDACLVMCHPGHADDILRARDGVSDSREGELAYLASDEFPQDLNEAGVELSGLSHALAQYRSAPLRERQR